MRKTRYKNRPSVLFFKLNFENVLFSTGVLKIVSLMDNEFGLTINSETLKDYIIPYVPPSKSVNEVILILDIYIFLS